MLVDGSHWVNVVVVMSAVVARGKSEQVFYYVFGSYSSRMTNVLQQVLRGVGVEVGMVAALP
jgi:hypothetical protein